MTAPREVRLPPERFYWALLDTGALPRALARREAQLGYLFEAVLPVPIDTIQAVYRALEGANVLGCGMDRETLRALAGPDAISLGSAALPECVGSSAVEPASLNLLVGALEPMQVRRARTRTTAFACAALLLCALAIGFGQLRRAARGHDAAASFAQATTAVYGHVLPSSTSAIPPSAQLTAELRALDRTRGDRPAASAPQEITPTLAAVLASWPLDLHATTDALAASPTAITLSVRLPDEAAAERFERELRPPPGWRLAQPNVQRERDGIGVRVRMEPEGGQ